ncbi:MAG: DsbA family protein [Dongiaceae bacterium]
MKRYWFIGCATALLLAAAAFLNFNSPLTADDKIAMAASTAPPENMTPLPEDKINNLLPDPVLGNANAPVTIVEYASFTCPHCAHFHEQVLPQLKEKYLDTGKAKLIFREFPFDKVALSAALLVRCLPNDQYFAAAGLIFKTQNSWIAEKDHNAALINRLRIAGLTEEKARACLDNKAMAEAILQRQLEAQQKLGITSTPSFLINGRKLVGARPIEDFAAAIEANSTQPSP